MTYFAVGYGGIYHRDHFGNWTNHTPGGITASYRIMSVYGVLQNEAYAVGYYYYLHDSIFYKWDGDTWTTWNVTPYPNFGNTGRYWRANHISGASRDEIYIVFYDTTDRYIKVWKGDYTGNGAYILETGTSPYYANGCGYTADSDEFYLPLRGCSAPNTYMKKWNGYTWSNSSGLSAPVLHISGANGNIYTTYGGGGPATFNIYRGAWDTWNTDSSPANFYMQTYQQESDMWAYGNKCWITGWYDTSSTKPALAYYNGTSWSTILLANRIDSIYYTGIVGKDDSHVLAVYNKGYAYFYDGSTWTEEAIGASFDVQDVDYGPDSDPPELVDQDPAPDSRISASDSLIAFSIVDASEVEASSIDAYVNNIVAFTSETHLSPFDGPSASFSTTSFGGLDGYRIVLDYTSGDWDSYQLITVRVVARDNFLNLMDTTYSFRARDTVGVEFTNIIPTPSSIQVDKNTLIQVDIFDRGSGVNSASIDAYVEGIHAYIGNTGSFVYPYNGSLSALTPVVVTIDGYNFDGYRIIINKQGFFRSGAQINIIVDGLDKEGN